ncbi:MAG TPA: ribosome maturation factor RimM [Longimicrobiales bacterium]|nr:ribosome maturation factor RimM [Longimicrobiales bacterium]
MTETGERASPDHLVVGHISKAHGNRGELFVWPLTDSPAVIFAPGRELLLGDEAGARAADGATVEVESARAFKRGVLVKFAGVEDRDAAGLLARHYLLLHRAEVPPLDDDEVFYHELLGMTVEDVAGGRVGRVREVFETEPHHLLEVEGEDGRMRLIPFAARIVREVDRVSRRVVIDPPAGLLDL